MKIAIASTGATPDSDVSQHGARAPFYLIYHSDGSLHASLSNPYIDAERGAAPKVARFLTQQDVQLLVAGSFGERFMTELEADGIRQVQKTGSIADLLTEVLEYLQAEKNSRSPH
ncbi:MAG: NifB/NifX family molybdenum-iron cluster-binding protein [Pseudomonadota bacterium]|nr:NifB/NifX family molybdenum-iron cluster-binding protein [Pseudomonadota bacterium]